MTNYPTYKLGELISEAIGGDWGKDPNYDDQDFELAYCIRGSEFKNWKIDNASTAVLRKIKKGNLAKRQLRINDIVVEISGGGPEQPVGRTEVITGRVLGNFKGRKALCTNFLRLIRPNDKVDAIYLNHYLKFFYSTGEIIKYQAGSNNLRNLKFNDYLTLPIPLPPLPTQQAIVARIEALFAELDKAAEHLRTAQQQLKTYRQAVLNHWLNNDDGKWETVKLGEVAEMCLGKMLDKNKNKGTYQPYLRNVNVRWGSFDLDDLLEMRFEESEQDRYGVRKGDLIMCEGGEPGRCAIWNATVPNMKIQKALHRIRVRDSIYNKFVYYLFSLYAQNGRLEKYFTGTTIKHLTGQSLKTIEIPLPPLTEQHRIVKEIESRLSQATTSETYIEKALQQAEALRQSILKKAFSGELV